MNYRQSDSNHVYGFGEYVVKSIYVFFEKQIVLDL